MKPIESRFPPSRVFLQTRRSCDNDEVSEEKNVRKRIGQHKESRVASGKVVNTEPHENRQR